MLVESPFCQGPRDVLSKAVMDGEPFSEELLFDQGFYPSEVFVALERS